MKKAVSLIPILILILFMIQTVALAETGYAYIKDLITNAVGNGFSQIIKDAQSVDGLYTSTTVTLLVEVYKDENNLMLVGRNSAGQPEATLWTATPIEQYVIMGTFCTQWRATNAIFDNGYSLAIVYFGAEDDPMIISTAEQADLLAPAFALFDTADTPASLSSEFYTLGFSFDEFRNVFNSATADLITSSDIQPSGEGAWLYSYSSTGLSDFDGGAIVYKSVSHTKDEGRCIEVMITYDNSSDQFEQWASGIHCADDLFATNQYQGFIEMIRRFIQLLAPGTTNETTYQVLAVAIQKAVAEDYKYVKFDRGEGTGYPRTGDFEFQFSRGGNWMELDARRYQEGPSPLDQVDGNPVITPDIEPAQTSVTPIPTPTSTPEPTPTLTPSPYPCEAILIKTSNFRKAASAKSSKLGEIKKGTRVTVSGETLSDGEIWYQVEYGKKTGYIRGDLIELVP